MKKFMLSLLMFATFLCMTAERKDVDVWPTNGNTSTHGTKHPRTPEPSIYVYIEDGVLTVSIGRYLGYVSTTIQDSSDTEVDNDIEYINGTSTYVMNVSSLTPGAYSVYFAFSDGREYYGTFTVE